MEKNFFDQLNEGLENRFGLEKIANVVAALCLLVSGFFCLMGIINAIIALVQGLGFVFFMDNLIGAFSSVLTGLALWAIIRYLVKLSKN